MTKNISPFIHDFPSFKLSSTVDFPAMVQDTGGKFYAILIPHHTFPVIFGLTRLVQIRLVNLAKTTHSAGGCQNPSTLGVHHEPHSGALAVWGFRVVSQWHLMGIEHRCWEGMCCQRDSVQPLMGKHHDCLLKG